MKALGVVVVTVVVAACGNGGGGGASAKGGSTLGGMGGAAAGAPGGGTAGRGAAGASGSGGAAPQGRPLMGVVAVSAGSYHACALLKSGSVYCWGVNGEGELGNGSTTDSTMAVPVTGISTATAIAASFDYTCALLADGTVSCWGSDETFELGSNIGTYSPTPIAVPRLSSGATLIAARAGGACAVVGGGSLQCWGGGWGFRFVDGGTDLAPSLPMTVANVSGVTAISVSIYPCVLTAGGEVRCWGENLDPTVVTGVTASAISGNCAIVSGGNIQCWQDLTFVPADAGTLGPGGFTSLSANESSLCAVQGATGAVYCMGPFGPTQVSGLTGAGSVSVGTHFACAAMNDGTAQCWGDNQDGQLGNGMIQASAGPATVLVPQ